MFRGRSSESELRDRLLDDARGGGSMLVIRGMARVGKTALMRHASGFRVAQVAGVESEQELPFARLHLYQLCAPFLDRIAPAAVAGRRNHR